MKLEIQIDDRAGDKVLVLSSAQFTQYQADPVAFIAWLDKTGRLPEPEPPPVKKVVETVKSRVSRRRKQ
jgi:hypothetical protein